MPLIENVIRKGDRNMSNSSLVNYIKLSPNCNSPRNHAIDTVSIHCMAGDISVETCGDIFANSSRGASANYGIDSTGRIGLYVEECNRSWCSSSSSNDNRAITIEVANDGGAETGWHVSSAAMNSLINLLVDICKRNGINDLKWVGDPAYIGNTSIQNMTVHRWFSPKECPGEYLYNMHPWIAQTVNEKLHPKTNSFPQTPFEVSVLITDLNYRSEPSMNGQVKGHTGKGTFTIVEVCDDWGKLKSGAGWIYLGNSNYCKIGNTVASTTFSVKVDIDDLNIRTGAGTNYTKTGHTTGRGVFSIVEVQPGSGSDNGWGKLKSGAGWISLDYVTRV